MPKLYGGQIPFNADNGHMLDSEFAASYFSSILWVPNLVFEASMAFTDFRLGRSSVRIVADEVILKSVTPGPGRRYSMSIQLFWDVLTACDMKQGTTPVLRWSFRKQGSYFSLVCVEDMPNVSLGPIEGVT